MLFGVWAWLDARKAKNELAERLETAAQDARTVLEALNLRVVEGQMRLGSTGQDIYLTDSNVAAPARRLLRFAGIKKKRRNLSIFLARSPNGDDH